MASTEMLSVPARSATSSPRAAIRSSATSGAPLSITTVRLCMSVLLGGAETRAGGGRQHGDDTADLLSDQTSRAPLSFPARRGSFRTCRDRLATHLVEDRLRHQYRKGDAALEDRGDCRVDAARDHERRAGIE